jgi:hypothetical protein
MPLPDSRAAQNTNPSAGYGLAKTAPFSEELHLTQTISPDAATKMAGEFLITSANITKARRLLGYQPATPPRIGLPRFIEWFHQTRVST